MRHIRGVLIDPFTNTITKHILKYNDYKDLYPLLDCECFTIAHRAFSNKSYDIYCDDNALIRDIDRLPAIVTIGRNFKEIIYNKCFICSHNRNGDIKSLNKEELEDVLSCKVNVQVDDKFLVCLKCSL